MQLSLLASEEYGVTRDLQVVLKVAERCNINCTYCYYLNSGNDSPHQRPAYISEDVARSVVRFIQHSASEIDIGQLRIVLHGGEPLMLKKARFRAICEILRGLRASSLDPRIVMTTNAMLIDDEWIEIFEEFAIAVCVSLDGPQQYHDLERVDFQGRGTYIRVLAGIEQLKSAAARGRILEPSVLCVIDPRFRGDVVYDHVIRKLGFRVADFLVPMTLHDSNPRPENIAAVGQFLKDVFEQWVADDDPGVRVRILNKFLTRLLGRSKQDYSNQSHIVVGVGSDGSMVNDDLMQVLGPQIFDRDLNIAHTTMSDYLSELNRGELAGVYEAHHECVRCKWFDVCRPANTPWNGAEMRYRRDTGFRNKLVHCEAYQELFGAMKAYIQMASADGLTPNTTPGPVASDHLGSPGP